MRHLPAAALRPVVSTVGAGDALYAAFLHFYVGGMEAAAALERATVFAAHKIGEVGGSSGFLSGAALEALYHRLSDSGASLRGQSG